MNEAWLADQLRSISTSAPVLIAGPTASGKSALALALALRDGRSVVNADALQVYARWRILTARPSVAEEALAPHHLYGHVDRDAAYSVGHWLIELAKVLADDRAPVIVGGTGLYLSAATEGLAVIPPTPPDLRALADQRRLQEGYVSLLAELDTATRSRIDQANPARVQRAWEVLAATGRGLADWQRDTPAALIPQGRAELLVLRPEPSWLNARIEGRFDQMIAEGALDEVRREQACWQIGQPSSKAIGAPELISHLRGEMSLDQAVAAAKLSSRQYAKRQRTWFRNRMKDWRGLALP